MALILALAVGMVPSKKAQAQLAGEPAVFTASAYGGHYGRSDLRSYVSGLAKENDTLPLDTTNHARQTSGYYESRFSDAEYNLVQPVKNYTNVLKQVVSGPEGDGMTTTAVYETTDLFWLPSGKEDTHVISWGREDISAFAQYSKSIVTDKARIVPASYWNYPYIFWLRSTIGTQEAPNNCRYVLKAMRGKKVEVFDARSNLRLNAACKINLESVIFASAASAKDIVGDSGSGAKKIEIAGSEDFGKNVEAVLPDYGMYLKTRSDKTFAANSLSLSDNNLTVGYMGGEAGQYVVVQAFNGDSLTAGTTGYVAAKQLEAGQNSATIDVTNWGVDSLDGYTVKVWMEDNTGSLARATIPETFVCINGVFVKTTDGAVQNDRVFSEKSGLQCSWGNLAALDDTAYNNVLAGNGQDGTAGNLSNLVCGGNPTNQKIIFGGMESWIAGRETAENGGTIDPNGDIMTLYQAKAVETRQFNGSRNNYDVAGKPAVKLQLAEGQTGIAGKVVYPEDQVTTENLMDGYTLNWLYRMPGTEPWTEGMPTALGTYEVRCYTPGTENYERTYSNVVNFIIKEEPKPWHFVFTGPSNLVYDGTPKTVTIEQKPGITGMGAITTKYYMVNKDGTETLLSGAPINAIKCRVKFYVAEGTKFTAATDLSPVFVPKN